MSCLKNKCQKVEHFLDKAEGGISDLNPSEKEEVFGFFNDLEKELKSNPAEKVDDVPMDVKKYLASRSLFLYAQTYMKIVQSVTRHQIGYSDLELNHHYQNIVKKINHHLSLEECKDFPGEFEPINDNIFPESGIGDIGWTGFADSCVDFLSRAQKFCIDNPPPKGNDKFTEAYLEWLKSRHLLIIKKAEDYDKKAVQLWSEFEKKHFSKKEMHDNSIENNKDDEGPETQGCEQPKLPLRCERAYQSYDWASDKSGLSKDKEVYEWLKENPFDDYEPNSFETWARYLREARKAYRTNKNKPRHSRSARAVDAESDPGILSQISNKFNNPD